MEKRLFDITGWYNNEANYPDMTLGLHDGTKILAHKAVLFSSNKYFESVCGPAISLGRPKSIVHLSESAGAVRVIVRMIYGFPLPEAAELSWGAWVDLAIAAKNYLEPKLSEKAIGSFLSLALDMTDCDEIVKMIEIVDNRMDDEIQRTVTLIRKHHACILLEHEGYRDTIRNTHLADLHLNDLLAKVKSSNAETQGSTQRGTFASFWRTLSNKHGICDTEAAFSVAFGEEHLLLGLLSDKRPRRRRLSQGGADSVHEIEVETDLRLQPFETITDGSDIKQSVHFIHIVAR